MLQINDLEIVMDKRIVLRVPEMSLKTTSINAIYGEEKSGKSLFAKTIHGLYQNYRGNIDFFNLSKTKPNSYLLTDEILLLQNETVHQNLSYRSKQHFESIREYSSLAGLESYLEIMVKNLTKDKQRLVELSIACGFYPEVLIIDDFDKSFRDLNLIEAGKLLSKFKSEGGTVLLTSKLKIPEVDSSFEIIDGKVEQYEK